MATLLDLGLLRYFSVIFSFILVWALVFALLQKTKILGDKAGLNVLLAVAVAFLVSLSDNVVQIINFMIPWFTIAIIFFVLLIPKIKAAFFVEKISFWVQIEIN